MPSLNAVFRLNDGYSRAINAINRSTLLAERSIMGASRSTDRLNQSIDRTESVASKAVSGLKRLATAAGGLFAVKQVMSITDEYTNTQARLKLINDELQTMDQLNGNIYLAAQRSRGSINDMAKSVAKLGMMAGDAFGSTQEIVDFTELVNKSFKVGGASKGEQQAGMYQLSQAMASGRLQGDEFRSISENAPMIGQALQKYLGVGAAELKEMSSQGQITADVIKNAMFSMGDEINTMFEGMPMTFADVGTQISNHASYMFQGVMQKLNETLNSDSIKAFIDMMKGGIDIVAQGVYYLITLLSYIPTIITANWNIIQPILIAIGIVMLPLIIAKLWAMLPPLLAAAGTWLIMNWPILLIIGLIALFIFFLQKMGVTTGEIVGYIVGTFTWLGAVIYNVFAMCYNVSSSFAEFLLNVFNNPIDAIKALFYDMGIYVNQIFTGIARQIDKLINSISKFTGFTSDLAGWFEGNIATLQKEVDKIKSKDDYINLPKMELKDTGAAFNKGFNWGNDLTNSISMGGFTPPQVGGMATNGIGDYMSNGALPVTNGKGGGSSLNVSIDKEDIKYLKDIAERDFQAKYTQQTLAPNIQITFGDVKETADVNELEKALERIINEQIAVVGEG